MLLQILADQNSQQYPKDSQNNLLPNLECNNVNNDTDKKTIDFIIEKSSIDDHDNFKVSNNGNGKFELEQRKQLDNKYLVVMESIKHDNKNTTAKSA